MQEHTLQSDNELIIGARNGSEPAFSELVRRYDRRVMSLIANFVQSSDDAKDIYQEVFIRVYRSLQKFEFRREFSTWLYRITTNVCLSYRSRSKKRMITSLVTTGDDDEKELPLTDPNEVGPEAALLNNEKQVHLQKAIEKLAPQQRMVLVLKHVNHHKIKEIAEMMGCSEGTVKKYLFLAVNKLRLELKGIEY